MKEQKILFKITLFAILFLIVTPFLFAQTEQITFTSYYPAPFGAYDRVRFVGRTTEPAPCDIANPNSLGLVYFDTSLNSLRACVDLTVGWVVIGGSTGSVWTQSVNDIFPTDTPTNPNLRVGIGTVTPGQPLEISAPEAVIRMRDKGQTWGGTAGGFIEFLDDTTRGGWLGFGGGYDENLYLANERPNKGVRFNTEGTTRMSIDNIGNVGIGTTTPTSTLDVVGDISASGNVGIGTNTPTQALDVNGSIRVNGQGNFGGDVLIAGQPVWYPGNDGSGSGLDADKIEGKDLFYQEVPVGSPTMAQMCFSAVTTCSLQTKTCSGGASIIGAGSVCKKLDALCAGRCQIAYPNPCALKACNGDTTTCPGGTTNCSSGSVSGAFDYCDNPVTGPTHCDCFLSNSTYQQENLGSGLPAGTYCSPYTLNGNAKNLLINPTTGASRLQVVTNGEYSCNLSAYPSCPAGWSSLALWVTSRSGGCCGLCWAMRLCVNNS